VTAARVFLLTAVASGWNKVRLWGANVVAGRKYWLAVLGTGGQLAFRDQGSGSKD
jgi:hypothetical protein